ncbi:transposase [Sporolactobacillus terrae]|uniref:Transposase n=1 Tax=Sporolactobacillus terrae TaxID=269673 RepID=A0A5K7X160_9BACL|nr:transposase [Sporolactobacillus terrae]BBN99739.1 transposase [Sporolactobacillus terrae]
MSIDHDRRFKVLLHAFFDEFLEAFFPKIYQALDLSEKKFLSEELFADMVEGDKKRADVIAETKLKSKKDVILIVHLEAQNYYQDDFSERMYIYYSMIYLKFRKPVLPIAIFSYDGVRDEPDEFVVKVPHLMVVSAFHFLKLELSRMSWRKFMNSNNPAAAALMSKMNYSKRERVQVRLAFIRQMITMHLGEARESMINGFFETYLQLEKEEVDQLMDQAKKLPEEIREEVLKWPNSFYDRGKKEGIEQGIEQGIEEGIEQGERKAKEQFVRKLLQKGMSHTEISELTGLSNKEIIKLEDHNG